MTPEGRVKAKVNRVLDPYIKAGDLYKFMPVQNGFGKKGLDYYCCFRGKFFAIETKAPGKEPTALQWACIRELKRAGADVFIVDDDESLLDLSGFLGGY